MSVAIWRVAVEAAAYTANDLSDTGAKMTGGRWNGKGTPLVYCATNIALATLETVHYLRNGAWIASAASALLLVPCVIVPDAYNVLINPRHDDAAAIVATTLKRWIYDPRFFP